jgi:hypothetical protein
MTSADCSKDLFYKTELPPLPILNGKEDCRGRQVPKAWTSMIYDESSRPLKNFRLITYMYISKLSDRQNVDNQIVDIKIYR